MNTSSYDQIAAVYSTDMGQSMRFDDVAYYLEVCRRRGGKVLECGCGTGRILLPLLENGVDIEGLDNSEGMLRELRIQANERGLQPQVRLGSLQQLGTGDRYSTIIAAYSVITYLTVPGELAQFLQRCSEALDDTGILVIDTFIPREVRHFSEFRLDYRRAHGSGTLQREKRISKADACNSIERRYTLFDAAGKTVRSWTTVDLIRPYTEAELLSAAGAAGFTCRDRHYDYGAGQAESAQFVTLHLVRGR